MFGGILPTYVSVCLVHTMPSRPEEGVELSQSWSYRQERQELNLDLLEKQPVL